jgi:hypothetical protein
MKTFPLVLVFLFSFAAQQSFGQWSPNFTQTGIFYNAGNVGIGVVDVIGAKLQVAGHTKVDGNIKIGGNLYKGGDSRLNIYSNSTSTNSRSFIELWGHDAQGTKDGQLALAGTFISFRTASSTTGLGVERVKIDPAGNLLVGGDAMQKLWNGDYKLGVDGQVICEALRVSSSSNWPDYVFEKDYDLMSLDEVERSIEKNGHLPGIPSAEVVEEEGIDVGEMQRLMMEKIEELTLYVIDLKKENDELKEEIKKLKE